MARKKMKGKIERTKNYIVRDFRNPPRSEVIGYRTVKQGDHLIRVAILKKKGPRGGRTRVTSIWHPRWEKGSKDPGVNRVLKSLKRKQKPVARVGRRKRGR